MRCCRANERIFLGKDSGAPVPKRGCNQRAKIKRGFCCEPPSSALPQVAMGDKGGGQPPTCPGPAPTTPASAQLAPHQAVWRRLVAGAWRGKDVLIWKRAQIVCKYANQASNTQVTDAPLAPERGHGLPRLGVSLRRRTQPTNRTGLWGTRNTPGSVIHRITEL